MSSQLRSHKVLHYMRHRTHSETANTFRRGSTPTDSQSVGVAKTVSPAIGVE